jgi:hypothetical protein
MNGPEQLPDVGEQMRRVLVLLSVDVRREIRCRATPKVGASPKLVKRKNADEE